MAAARLTRESLKAHAITRSFSCSDTLNEAIQRLGFVQADPIRSPARAQDLILRQRVAGYRAGDLERHYPSLDVEEDYLYAYGFVSRPVWQLLHPRHTPRQNAFEQKVLETVTRLGEAHPRALEAHLGKRRVVNAWGGYSKATTNALEWLHWRGLLRIARRESGIRVYAPVVLPAARPGTHDRLTALIMVYARIFAPSPEKSLQTLIARHRELGNTRDALAELLRTGDIRKDTIDGASYVSPAEALGPGESPARVRFVAPFDPTVWDRTRFEHLWGWAYRFEAYTPVRKRVRGYYAMPMLWKHNFVGWANASVIGGRLDVKFGYVDKQPRGSGFRRELDREVASLSAFLQPRVRSVRL